jgi:hypothetical protein
MQKEFYFDSALCQKLHAMPHSAEFRIRAMFYPWHHAMPPSVKFKQKIFLPTPRYAAQRGFDSMLCRIVGSRNSALCSIAQTSDSAQCRVAHSCNSVLCGIARSRFSLSNQITPRIRICFSPWIRVPRGTVWRKKQSSKISWDWFFKETDVTEMINCC